MLSKSKKLRRVLPQNIETRLLKHKQRAQLLSLLYEVIWAVNARVRKKMIRISLLRNLLKKEKTLSQT